VVGLFVASACLRHEQPLPPVQVRVVDPPVAGAPGAQEPPPAEVRCPAIDPASYELAPFEDEVFVAPLPPIVDPTGRVMAPFHERVASLLRGHASEPIRIGIYGDSNMTQDGISGGMRRMLQAKLGDAGHGYVALGRAWPWYLHLDVKHGATYRKWKPYSTSVQPAPDAYYGFANMAFDSAQTDAMTYVETADQDAPVGHAVSRFDTYFLKRPAGGTFRVAIDGEPVRVVSTASPSVAAGFESFDVPDGPHRLELVVEKGDPVRVFGVTMERSQPGIVVDSLGTGALNYEQMTRVDGPTRRAMLERRKYDLVMFLLGSNVYPGSEETLTRWIRKAVDAHRQAVPGLPIVILSPTDIAESMDAKTSMPRIMWLAHHLGPSAAAAGAAYWDFWGAMGGNLSIVRLRKMRGMASSDLIHMTRLSGSLMGQRIAHALMVDFKAYVTEHPEAGCMAP
jgi:hypothetical protein